MVHSPDEEQERFAPAPDGDGATVGGAGGHGVAYPGLGALSGVPVGLSGMNVSEDDEQQLMLRRLWKSDELIKQLKHIVKAQHGKIEELRERLEFDPTGQVRNLMAAHDLSNFAKVKEDNEDLRSKLHRQQAEIGQLKKENETLRKANRRMKRMLDQERQDSFESSASRSPTRGVGFDPNSTQSSFNDTGITDPSSTGGSVKLPVTAPPLAGIGGSRSSESTSPVKRRPGTTGLGTPASGPSLPAFSKLSRLLSVMPLFWKDLESPSAVLSSLVEIAGRLLNDSGRSGHTMSITVYMLESWLRTTASDPASGPPTLFYLGQGKTTVQVFHHKEGRPEPPRFADLQALPFRTRTALAVAMTTPTSHSRLGVLQAVCVEDHKGSRSPAQTPRVLREIIGRRQDSPAESREHTGFSDSQMMYLQLVCTVAGGILEQLKRADAKQRLLDRMRACVDVAVGINKARSLSDFEQRVKHQMSTFFTVTTVRVLFYDAEAEELLVSSAQNRRKGVHNVRLDKGVVGLCAKRQAVIHVANISHHPYIDAAADGLQRTGRPVGADAAMLCGPLIVDYDEGGKLIGVVQLLERRKKNANMGEQEYNSEFSNEEQSLFQQLLRVCAHAAWRTYRVQDLSAQVSTGQSVGLARMLAG
mmetsp:Transcript_56336/g.98396  ORF Transcript_56336/g.98396 Transcript_56336/m.98396 type:complete len:644 (-) Transcript_56336:34-1965(-)